MIKVAITGITGRMGRSVLELLMNTQPAGLQLGAAIHRDLSELVGQDASLILNTVSHSAFGVPILANLPAEGFDVVIDFSLPDSTMRTLDVCVKKNRFLVVGTTGFDDQQHARFADAARTIPIVLAPNMSIGVTLCMHLLRQTANTIGQHADVEVIETHHRNKLDSPSGTALAMGQTIADELGWDLQANAVYSRHGKVDRRNQQTIGYSSIRAGDVIGDHTVLFATEGERIEIAHKASDRSIYAKGALRAAQWVVEQPPGLYTMEDVLGLMTT